MAEIVTVAHTNDSLGECPVWCPREQALYWVDSRAPALRRYDYKTGDIKSWAMPEVVGSFALREKGGFLVGLQTCIAFFDPGKPIQSVAAPEPAGKGMRFNDGKCDRKGRYWVGTKRDGVNDASGSIYRLTPDLVCAAMDQNIVMPNSLAWSPDNRTMYFADSMYGTIFTYPFDLESGSIGKRQVFAKCDWHPDGATVDLDGFLWSAGYHGWRITRYAPNGHVDRVIEMPMQCPTSCAFGGPALDILYVTTARQRLSEEQLAKQPLAGALLALDVGVRGLPEPRFAG
jgi:sugar lactone lactonase YvrE